ncbi:MAG TPA: ABC transporter permease [Sulfuricaulis sp.]|nr:ABC transporter permease [Sulfuricaulis sp.]
MEENLGHASLYALRLLLSGDPDLWNIIGVSFSVSVRAILISAPAAMVLAFLLAYARFPARLPLISTLQSLQSIPTVVVGLLVYMLLSRRGLFGDLHLLFTQTAMVIGQIVIAFLFVVPMAHGVLAAADRRAWETARTLGAAPWRAMFTVMTELRFGLLAVAIAAFARIITEVGTSIMVGGNIESVTRNIPTAIALETSKGEFAQGIALGLVLLVLALLLNVFLGMLQGKGEMR